MGKIYGYARISTAKQSIERQIRNIKEAYPDILDACIYAEAYTGTKASRPQWDKLLKVIKSGDVIVFDSVSRMSRNADDGTEMYFKLYDQGISLVFLKERYIDTATYEKALNGGLAMTGTAVDCILEGINQYMRTLATDQIRLAFTQAQKEVDDLHKRTAEGIETARRAGKQIGHVEGTKLTTKKSIEAKSAIREYNYSFGGPLSDKDTIKIVGISRNSFYKYKKEMMEQA